MVGVFLVYAAPVVLSGEPTFGGYSVLGDTAIHFLASDQLQRDGLDLSALPASEYRSALEAYFVAASYPAGAQLGARDAARPRRASTSPGSSSPTWRCSAR